MTLFPCVSLVAEIILCKIRVGRPKSKLAGD